MIYLNLTNSYKDFDKARIVSFTFHANGKIVFTYQVYKTIDIALFEKTIIEGKEAKVAVIKAKSYANTTPYDSICRALIEYLIDEGIETGTIEVQ